MNSLSPKMKNEYALRAVRQIIRLCDLDLWFQGHSSGMKPTLYLHTKTIIVPYTNTLCLKMKEDFMLQVARLFLSIFDLDR